MFNLQDLKKEIEQQTRNGKQTLYIKTSDLKELTQDLKLDTTQDRTYIELVDLENYIRQYEQTHIIKEDIKSNASNHTKLTDINEAGFHFEPIERH